MSRLGVDLLLLIETSDWDFCSFDSSDLVVLLFWFITDFVLDVDCGVDGFVFDLIVVSFIVDLTTRLLLFSPSLRFVLIDSLTVLFVESIFCCQLNLFSSVSMYVYTVKTCNINNIN